MNILGTDSFTPQAAIVHERVFYDLGNYVVLLKVLSTFSTKRERGRICTVKSKDQAKVNRIIIAGFLLITTRNTMLVPFPLPFFTLYLGLIFKEF